MNLLAETHCVVHWCLIFIHERPWLRSTYDRECNFIAQRDLQRKHIPRERLLCLLLLYLLLVDIAALLPQKTWLLDFVARWAVRCIIMACSCIMLRVSHSTHSPAAILQCAHKTAAHQVPMQIR